jgi:hypothetical protein
VEPPGGGVTVVFCASSAAVAMNAVRISFFMVRKSFV